MYFSLMTLFSLPIMFLFMFLLFMNTFISIEFNLINFKMMYIPISFMLDWMSCLFIYTVIFISSMILLFSIFYIPKQDHNKFSLILLLFIFSMSILIISDNIIFILLGWDGLGLSSYILVIFYQNYDAASSGMITLMSNRMGDIMILSSIALLSVNFNWIFNMNNFFSKITLFLLLLASISKSAQFPFSAWLPAAMAAPTPISALVHSSTLVTAGVFLMIRITNNIHPSLLNLILIISSMTAIYSSMAANWEMDMKKIVALSTLSQIAMMMFAISLKSSMMAFFHLIIHALFKSTMFLCVGIIIHSSSYQDMRMMGINSINSPLTLSILGISTFALMGIPFMSGFFSKDSIMEMMMESKMNSLLTFLMIMSLGLTISYSIRMIKMTLLFQIKSKPDMNLHFSNYSTIPIMTLTPMSIILGSTMMWILYPYQTFMIPFFFKLSIPMVISSSILLGISFNFINKMYLNMGYSSIKLWFIHKLSVLFFPLFSNTMKMMNINDKAWQEIYGPTDSHKSLMLSSNLSNNMLNITMLIFVMILIMSMLIM